MMTKLVDNISLKTEKLGKIMNWTEYAYLAVKV